MIETEQTVEIAAPIGAVWAYASDIRRWAALMPGLVDCDIAGEDNSRWTLKVGVGALVRTVKVQVHVDRWAGPEQVDFTFSLDGDPVAGGGTYRARALGPNETEVVLGVRVEGSGPMAPMWEAMGKPLLPKFAKAFAEQFKTEIEQGALAAMSQSVAASAPQRPASLWATIVEWLRRLFRAKQGI